MKSRSNNRVRQNGSAFPATKQGAKTPNALSAKPELQGVVKWFRSDLGSGFIALEAELGKVLKLKPQEDLSFYTKDTDGVREFNVGDKVAFVVEQTDKGLRASAVRVLEAAQVVMFDSTKAGAFLQMEEPVKSAIALLAMFGRKRSAGRESIGDPASANEACGYQILASGCARALDAQWREAVGDERALREGTMRRLLRPGQLPAAARLYSSVAKASALLKMMADEIANEDDEFEIREAERKGVEPNIGPNGEIALAKECSSKLEAAYEAAFDAWSEPDDAANQHA
jgi:cold shock CspA family protein